MIREFEQFHGFMLARLLHGNGRGFHIERFAADSNAGYVVDGRVGLYVKHCSKRMTPWRFTFQHEHRSEWSDLVRSVAHPFVALVCNDDGIVCIDASELGILLGESDAAAWIRAERHAREMYALTGSGGALDHKVGSGDFPTKIFSVLDHAARSNAKITS